MALRLNTDSDQTHDPDGRKAELTEHLGELRVRLIRACVYCALGMLLMYALYAPIYRVLASPILRALAHVHSGVSGLPAGTFIFNSFTEPFLLKLQISMVGGLVLAVPFVILELWGFISPGLTTPERRAAKFVAPMSVGLFMLGVSVAYFILPMAVRWFLSYLTDVPNAVLFQNPLTYIVFVVKLMLVFGLVFQLPVVLMFLGKIGVITSALMIQYWRQISVALFTLAMVVAPSNDPGTMLALAIPLTILFFGSISLVKMVEPKRS
jgi:sec-independent protein translocase protein TatC